MFLLQQVAAISTKAKAKSCSKPLGVKKQKGAIKRLFHFCYICIDARCIYESMQIAT